MKVHKQCEKVTEKLLDTFCVLLLRKKSMLSSQEKPIDSLEHFDLNCSVLVPAVRSMIIV